MKYEELKKRVHDEELDQYSNIRFDSYLGGYNGINILREINGTFCVTFCDERGSAIAEWKPLSEEEACNMVYEYAAAEKRFREWKQERENKKPS